MNNLHLHSFYPKPVDLTNLPELKRVAKSSVFQGEFQHQEHQQQQQQGEAEQQRLEHQQALTRNMLMNIILRPGGGDKTRALPRPQVRSRPLWSSIPTLLSGSEQYYKKFTDTT